MHENNEPSIIQLKTAISDLLEFLSAMTAVQNSGLMNRLLYNDNTYSLEEKIRNFLDDAYEKTQDLETIFFFRYGTQVSQLLKLECDLDDNINFWNNFCDDVQAKNSASRFILAYAVLITVAELQISDHDGETKEAAKIRRNENLRALDMMTHIYQSEVKSDIPDTERPTVLGDILDRNLFIYNAFPFDRDFSTYQTRNIPDILHVVGDFIKPMAIDKNSQYRTNHDQQLDPDQKTAEVIDIKHWQRIKPFAPKPL